MDQLPNLQFKGNWRSLDMSGEPRQCVMGPQLEIWRVSVWVQDTAGEVCRGMGDRHDAGPIYLAQKETFVVVLLWDNW